MSNAKKIAQILLEKHAIKLHVKEPFTFASGIRSPIYCDIRVMLGFHDERQFIIKGFLKALKNIDYDIIAGTSTAGIPWAAYLSHKLEKPMAYIRGEKKDHGAGKQIEGADVKGKKVVILEDMITTGGSSYAAVDAARQAGAHVMAVVSIFTYEFEKAGALFKDGNCPTISLSNFSTLIKVAQKIDMLNPEELKIAKEWNKDPQNWGPKNGFPNAAPKI